MSVPCQYPFLPPAFRCWSDLQYIALIVVLGGRVLQVLEHEISPPLFFTGKTVSIEPATSLFIISHPACDAIWRK